MLGAVSLGRSSAPGAPAPSVVLPWPLGTGQRGPRRRNLSCGHVVGTLTKWGSVRVADIQQHCGQHTSGVRAVPQVEGAAPCCVAHSPPPTGHRNLPGPPPGAPPSGPPPEGLGALCLPQPHTWACFQVTAPTAENGALSVGTAG